MTFRAKFTELAGLALAERTEVKVSGYYCQTPQQFEARPGKGPLSHGYDAAVIWKGARASSS